MGDIYRAIADPVRRRILYIASQKECTQSELVQAFRMSQPAIHKHIRILKEEGLISERKIGKYSLYSLNVDSYALAFAAIQQELGQILQQKLVRLKYFLEKERED
ncbi:ArsR/SmtB family transcription factor [Bacillus testis]|uniref:ArsR/SmtB family transcription factor n=1 Tax=Bacillus testis TaxID=1622072 RepID=UPI00067F349E|nr:metalloregulator ArsR/SmtB family transcription factor [Bacillus testis]